MNIKLTNELKNHAHKLGADLVGIANIERFAKAPIMMSPQGILPEGKSVIVCAIHHPDACVQMGGETHPQDIGPYAVQYVINSKLDFMAFRIAKFLDELGFKAIPIASSNIWRYRKYKDLNADFAPDMSHIYAATLAGLGQIGWHGMTITPEYGAWNRFVSIITDAELESTPLYDGTKLCDMCGECIKNCPTDAYRKEVNGVNVIECEDKAYKFANKNLWRCAWAEHFDLDLDLDIPDKVDEQVILDHVKKHGIRGGEFGCCLKYCLPPQLRGEKNGEYTKTYKRKRHVVPTDLPVHRGTIDKIVSICDSYYTDDVSFVSKEKLKNAGINIENFLPDANGAIIIGSKYTFYEGTTKKAEMLAHYSDKNEPDNISKITHNPIAAEYRNTITNLLNFASLDVCRALEGLGYSAVTKTEADFNSICKQFKITSDCEYKTEIVITSAAFKDRTVSNMQQAILNNKIDLTENLIKEAKTSGADTVGIVSAGTIDMTAKQIKNIKDGEEILLAYDKNTRFCEFDAEVKRVKRKLHTPKDYLKDAKNVIVMGIHFPDVIMERLGKPPAEAVGPYVFSQYETKNQLGYLALHIVKFLESLGHKAVFTYDLLGIGTQTGTPRGYIYSADCNSVEAVSAGLGELTYNRMVYNKKYGINQRFISVITDADLTESEIEQLSGIQDYCEKCRKCINICPAKAMTEEKGMEIEIAGVKQKYIPADANRCNWASKYALCNEDGFKYIGSKTDEQVPKTITEENLTCALKKTDPVLKHRPVTAEKCIAECPLSYNA